MPWQNQYINQLVVQGANSGIFIYNGAAGPNNLIGSWSSVAGVDAFGNPFPQGINVTAGILTGVSIKNSAFIAGTIMSTLISASQMTSSAITGGTITESIITFDSAGGGLFLYSSSTTTTTITTLGNNNFTGPAGVATLNVSVWGADAGGGGGGFTSGGEGGGAGEFAQETAYPNTPGFVYSVGVGTAGVGGNTGNPGLDGQQSSFDNAGVVAGGGLAGVNFAGGLGGNISTNSIHFPGGKGGTGGLGAASAGGGGKAGSTGAGGNGGNSGASPGAAGAAGTGTGGVAGGAGVAAGTNGLGGGGGSGAGQGSAGTTYITKNYDPTSTDSYYGDGVGGGQKNHNASMYQGCPNSGLNNFPGDTKSYANYNHSAISSDFSGATIDSVTLTINNQHSWFSQGNYLVLSYADGGGDHYCGNTNGVFWTAQGQTAVLNVSNALNSVIKNLVAIKLGPSANTGNATSLWNYGFYQGGAGQGGPRLTVKGHIGTTGNFTAGNGSNGKVVITYQSSNVLVGAVSPLAGNDGASNNAFAAGFTGQGTAFHPLSSPTTAETWQPMTGGYTNSWSDTGGGNNAGRYRKLFSPPNTVEIEGTISHASVTGTSNIFTLPLGYRPTSSQQAAVWFDQANHSGTIGVANTGVLSAFNLNVSTLIQFHGFISLD